MSAGTKKAIGLAALALLVVAAGIWGYQLMTRTPSSGTILAQVVAATEDLGVDWSDLSVQKSTVAGESVGLEFTVRGKLREDRLESVPAEPYWRSEFGVDGAALAELRRELQGAQAVRWQKAIGSVGDALLTTARTEFAKQVLAAGTAVEMQATIEASKSSGDWSFGRLQARELAPQITGRRRSAFSGPMVLLDDTAEISRLRMAAEQVNRLLARLPDVRQQIAAEVEAEEAARFRQFADLLAPATLFTGFFEWNDGRRDPISIEINQFDAVTRRLAASLRNDGGWSDARPLQGAVRFDAAANSCQVTLSTRADQAIGDAGPILEINSDVTWEFTLKSTGELTSKGSRAQTSLTRMSDNDREQFVHALRARFDAALLLMEPGSVFSGTTRANGETLDEPVVLEIEEVNPQTGELTVVLRSPASFARTRSFNGAIVDNRHRFGTSLVHLRLNRREEVNAGDNSSVFRSSDESWTRFAVEEGDLVGGTGRRSYRLKKLAPAETEAWFARDQSVRDAFNRLLQNGAQQTGILRNKQGQADRVRLRINEVDAVHNLLVGAIEAVEVPGVVHNVRGSFDAGTGVIQLYSAGGGKYLRRGGALVSALHTQDLDIQFSLQSDWNGVVGKLAHFDWYFDLPWSEQSDAASRQGAVAQILGPIGSEGASADGVSAGGGEATMADLPTDPGAYIAVEGKWVALPVTRYSTMPDPFSLLKPADQVGVKLATLTLAEQEQPVVVDGKNVVLIFVGARKQLSSALMNQYPQLRDHAKTELAPVAVNRKGKRTLELFRFVPGAGDFGGKALAAAETVVDDNLVILRPKGTLAAGDYAFAANETIYELRVKP